MGYPVYYRGEVEIRPSLTEEHAAIVRAFADGKHIDLTEPVFAAIAASEDPDLPCFSGLLDVSEDCSLLIPEEDESRHGLARGLRLLARHFFGPSGYMLNGEISWSTDEADDRGRIFIKDNMVEAVEDVTVNPGPSWAPESFADQSLVDTIKALIESADNEGCSPDLTVVSSAPIEALRTVLPKLVEFATLTLT